MKTEVKNQIIEALADTFGQCTEIAPGDHCLELAPLDEIVVDLGGDFGIVAVDLNWVMSVLEKFTSAAPLWVVYADMVFAGVVHK